MILEGKELEVQAKLLGVCSDVLLEARYPLSVSGMSLDRVVKKLEKIRKLVR